MTPGLRGLLTLALGSVLTLLALCTVAAGAPPIAVTVVVSRAAAPYDAAVAGLEAGLIEAGLRPVLSPIDLGGDRAGADLALASLRARPPSVVVTLGSLATTALAGKLDSIPQVFCMVLDPAQSGLPAAGDRGGRGLTGVTMDIHPGDQLRALSRVLPSARRVGILFSPASERAVAEAEAAARPLGLTIARGPVGDQRDVARALTALTPKMDVLLAVPDPTVYTETSTRYVLLQTLRQAQPFVGLMDSFAQAGALMAVGLDYADLGRQAAAQVARIASGEDAGAIPVEDPRTRRLLLNLKTARRIGVVVPAGVLADAEVLVQ